MTFSREWAIHSLFLQGRSPIGEPAESILHQRTLALQLSQLDSIIPLALPAGKT